MSGALASTDAGAASEALALAALVRDSVASGVERRALLVRLSTLPEALREPRHARLIEETMGPALRPTRARVFELPGGDRAVIAPPPGQHLEALREGLARLLPEVPIDDFAPLLRLPAEAARLLGVVEDALGLGLVAEEALAETPPPAPAGGAMDAALRALAGADIAAIQRRQAVWRLGGADETAVAEAMDIRAHLPELAERLLPGAGFAMAPALARRLRRAAERRLLADLARPPGVRALGALALPLSLGTVTEAEALRLYGAIGPEGRARLTLCVPLGDALADPAGLALARRFTAARGIALGLDDVEPWHLAALDVASLAPGPIRLRFRASLLHGAPAERAAIEAGLPADRARVVLTGVEAPVAVAWAWQRGITRFMGRLLEARRAI
ncbi:MAG: hypothetical protein MUC64_04690 [Rubritepida sp.]|nr:hypothetical protein [Rubritepida sp.]